MLEEPAVGTRLSPAVQKEAPRDSPAGDVTMEEETRNPQVAGRNCAFQFGRVSRPSPLTFESDFRVIFPRDELCCLSRTLPSGKPQNNKYELWLTYCVPGALLEISRGLHDNRAKIFVSIDGIREPRLGDIKRHSPGHTA